METETNKPSLFGMIGNPNKQFRRMVQQPVWLLPVAIVCSLFGAASFIFTDLIKSLLVMLHLSPGDTFFMLFFNGLIISTGVALPILIILILSGIYILIIKLSEKEATFQQLVSLNSHILFIGGIGFFLQTICYYVLFHYLKDLHSWVLLPFAALCQMSIAIWSCLLTAFGLQKVGQLSGAASWVTASVLFLIVNSFGLLSSLLGML